MNIGPGLQIQGGLNVTVPQDQYYPNNVLLLSYGSNTAPVGSSSPFNVDSSTNNFITTVVGATQNTNFHPFQPNGFYSNYFNGSTDKLTFSTSSAMSLDGQFTIECWVYWNGSTVYYQNFIGSNNTFTSNASFFRVWGTGFGTSALYNKVGIGNPTHDGTSSVYSTNSLTPNTWNHVAATRDSTNTIRVFINGTLERTGSSDSSLYDFGQGGTCIGDSPWDGANGWYGGYISNLRVLKGTCLYTTSFTPATSPLTAITNTSLLTCQSNRFIDNSTNNFTISSSGSPKVQYYEPFGFQTASAGTFSPTVTNTASLTNNYPSTYFSGSNSDNLLTNLVAIGTVDFTIETWVYLTSFSNSPIVIDFRPTTTNGAYPYIYFDTGGIPYYYVSSANVITGTATTLNAWHHLALSRTSSSTKLFLDGVQVGSTYSDSNNYLAATNRPVIGSGGYSSANTVTGYISNLRITKGVGVYTGNFTVPTSPLALTQSAGTNISAITTGQTLFLLNGTTYSNNNTFIDSSTNNFTVTRNGTPTQAPISPFYGTNYSVLLNGSSDYLTVPSTSDLVFGTGNFCVEVWYFQTVAASVALFSNSVSAGGGDAQFEMQIGASPYYPRLVGWATIFLESSVASVTNKWNHFVICRSGSTASIFLNGTRTATATVTNNFSNTNAFNIGRAANGGQYLTGYISNLRAVKGSSVYDPSQTSITVPTSPLTAVSGTSLLACQSNKFIDNSNYGYTITVVSSPKVSAIQPFSLTYASSTYGGSGYFNGSTDYLSIAYNSVLNYSSSAPFTFECWFYPTVGSTDNSHIAASQNGSVDANLNWLLRQTAANKVRFVMIQSGGLVVANDSTDSFTLNTWNHVAAVMTGSSTKLWVNGVYQSSQTFNGSQQVNGNITIGSWTSYYTGYISNARYVSSQVYTGTSNFTPSTAPLTAISNTQLLLNTSNFNTYDLTLSNYVTSAGAANQSTQTPFTTPQIGVTPSSISTYGGGYFSGSGAYLYFPNINFSTNAFTIEGWFYPLTLATATNFWGTDNGSGTTPKMLMYVNGSNQLTIDMGNAGSTQFPIAASISTYGPILNSWNHIALVRSDLTATGLKLYINGVLAGTGQLGTNLNTITAVFNIGYIGEGYGSPFTGYISNFRIVNGTAVYTSAFTPPTSPLTAISSTSLLTLQNNGPANNSGFIDSSPNAWLITRNGNVPQGSFGPYFPNGYWSNYFNGSTDYLTSSYTPLPATGTFTLEAWIYTTASAEQMIYSQYTSADSNRMYFEIANSSGYKLIFNTNGGGAVTGATVVPLNQWNHVAVTRDSSNIIRIFLNGAVDATSSTYTASIQQTTPRIGSFANTPAYYFTGYISNLRVVSGTALYTSAFTPSTTPLTAVLNTSLLTCQSAKYLDNSTNVATITPNGTPTVRRFQPFSPPNIYTPALYGASAYFDGSGDYLALPTVATCPIGDFGTSDFTVEFYMNASAAGTYVTVVGTQSISGYSTAGIWRCSNRYNSANGIYFNYTTGSTFTDLTFTTTNYNDGAWHHVAFSRASNTLRAFVDGVQVGSNQTVSQSLTSGQRIYVGYNVQDTAYYTGYVSDLKITKGTALYTSNFTVNTTPLTATSTTSLLLNMNSLAIYDRNNNTNLETLASGTQAQIQNNIKKLGAGSMSFNGTNNYVSIIANPAYLFGGNFTWECWVYFNNVSATNQALFGNYTTNASTDWLINTSTSTLQVLIDGSTVRISTTVAATTWYHIAVVRSGSTITGYLNGTSFGTYTSSSAVGSISKAIYIGNQGGSAQYLNGYLDSIRLTQAARYTANFTAPVDNPLYQ